MRKIQAHAMGVIIDAEVHGTRVYLKLNNPMLEPVFMRLLGDKNITPEKKGGWIVFEVNDAAMPDEDAIAVYLIDNFKKGGMQITNDKKE